MCPNSFNPLLNKTSPPLPPSLPPPSLISQQTTVFSEADAWVTWMRGLKERRENTVEDKDSLSQPEVVGTEVMFIAGFVCLVYTRLYV